MESTIRDILYQGNSTITVETHPDHAQPVVIKKPAKRHPSQRRLRSLENEYQMTRALNTVKRIPIIVHTSPIEMENLVEDFQAGGSLS